MWNKRQLVRQHVSGTGPCPSPRGLFSLNVRLRFGRAITVSQDVERVEVIDVRRRDYIVQRIYGSTLFRATVHTTILWRNGFCIMINSAFDLTALEQVRR